ncbi:T9SS type A sorting domain-containing protein [bacterium]|nr:MAG: T9SS type A sorting domain-containing protein [bacterium]
MKPLAALLAVLLAVPASALQVEKLRSARPAALGGGTAESEVVSGEALARFDAALTRAEREAALAARGATYKGEVATTGWTHVVLPAGMSVGSGLTLLGSISGVREVAPNNAYRPLKTPNDPKFSLQYHLGKVNAQAAWEYGVGDSTTVTVAVLDAGIDGTHPDLTPKLSTTSWFCSPGACKTTTQCADPSADSLTCVPENPPLAACNHGTRVAGVAAAATNNGSGVAGVSWGAKLISIRSFRQGDCTTACGDSGSGCATDDAAIAKGIILANSLNNTPLHGRIVLNISLGSTTGCASVLQAAINAAVATSTGMVITVSAGNEGGAVDSPANCNGVIPVGATDSNDNVASFSNRGTELANNGVVAPGVGLTTTDLGGGTAGDATGTSFSSPLVAGLSALIVAAKPSFSPTNVKDTLRGSADGIGVAAVGASAVSPAGNSAGAGRVNAFKAVKLAVEGTLAGYVGDQKVIAFPNPFRTNESGTVTITIPTSLQSRGTSIRVYTIDGQLVRDLKAQTTWDGKNDSGHQVASGTYLVLVKTDAGSQTAKVAVIR